LVSKHNIAFKNCETKPFCGFILFYSLSAFSELTWMKDKIQFMNFRNILLLYFNGMTKQAGLCGDWYTFVTSYRGADKSLARPGRKEARATEDFDVHVSYL
jgi:hypothetical protein